MQIKLGDGQTLGDLVPATIGRGETVEIGDTVFAAADPFGATRTFAPGVVMALPTAACYQSDLTGSFVHSSMSISPGAIGGALINTRGEVIGMLVPQPSLDGVERTAPETHTTFAMQIETAIGVGEALKVKRTNDSPWLGFSVLSFDEMRRKMNDAVKFDAIKKPDHGLFIDDVFDPSPASKAGIRPGGHHPVDQRHEDRLGGGLPAGALLLRRHQGPCALLPRRQRDHEDHGSRKAPDRGEQEVNHFLTGSRA